MVDNGKQNNKPFKLYRFLLQSLDPVHVGVGGYRLGRVGPCPLPGSRAQIYQNCPGQA